jgi:hypothetical protein
MHPTNQALAQNRGKFRVSMFGSDGKRLMAQPRLQRIIRRLRLFSLAAMCSALVSANGCGKQSDVPKKEIAPNLQVDDTPSLVFDIKRSLESSGPDNSQIYDCTYRARGRTAKFRIQFVQGTAYGGEISLVSAEGKFLAVSGSDDTVLLEDLKSVLEAKMPPKNSPRVRELAFDAVVLGQRQSRSPSGSFSDKPPGDWIATKIFLPKGGDEGEVYFNFNPVLGKAEFSIKDSDYGDYLWGALGKVL